MTPQELKNSILQLAIQGKLVEQHPEEGTAEELYRQIQQEKQALIKAGKIKKEKPFSTSILYKEYPFDIPESWIFVRFGDLMISRDSERVPVSTAEREHRNKIYDYYGASGVIDKIDNYIFDKKLLLIGEDGANLLARSSPIAFLAHGKYWVNNHAHVLDGCAGIYLEYICYYINAISLVPYVTGTAQPKMNQENMNAIWVALPPFAEQKRIVAKIEELLPYIDRYEKAWNRLEDFNKRFPADMQKSILQLAIQGKLVEQRSEEGTGEDLYQQIQKEKQALIKAGKIKKEKPLPEITEDEIPFEIPENWKWVRFGTLYTLSNGTASRGSKDGVEHPVLRLADLSKNEIAAENVRKIQLTEKEFESHQLVYDDLIFIRVNGSKDRVATAFHYTGSKTISYCDHLFCGHKTSEFVYEAYVRFAFNCPSTREQLIPEIKTTAGQNTISQASMVRTLLPLPPLAEQKRIVAKLEELLPLCDRLK